MPAPQQPALPAILFPGFTGEACAAIAAELISRGFPVVAVCEPGQASAKLAAAKGLTLVKARKADALRAGLSYCREEMRGLPGVVVADMREGYSLTDILAVAYVFAASPECFVIASRAKGGTDRRAGLLRACAGMLLLALHGRSVKDPWAGLRAIPSGLVGSLLELKGDGRKLAFGMVLSLHHKGVAAVSVPVGARYAPGDERERGERMKDILRILVLPFKYISSSLIATLLDYVLFSVFYYMLNVSLPLAQLAGRGTGAVTGYILNRNVVFRRRGGVLGNEALAALQFALLAAFNYAASVWIIDTLAQSAHVAVILAKMIADVILYISTFLIQREIIFRIKQPSAE